MTPALHDIHPPIFRQLKHGVCRLQPAGVFRYTHAPSVHANSVSSAGEKFMHPPCQPYSAWMNASLRDVSQRQTQMPPLRADTWVGQVQRGEAQVNHIPTAPGSMLSPVSKHSYCYYWDSGSRNGSMHSLGVGRMMNQVTENLGTWLQTNCLGH